MKNYGITLTRGNYETSGRQNFFFAFQINLWEEERNRFKFTDGVLYNQFLSQADYEVVKNYAENLNYLVWSSAKNRTIIVTKEGHDPVKKFWKHHSKN